MTRVTYYAAMSLDGRISGPDDDLAFLDTLEGTFPEGEYNMWSVIRSFDSMIVGANTFRLVVEELRGGTWSEWPYGDTPVWVMTHADSLPPVEGANLRHASGSPAALVSEIAATGAERTWLIGGANLAAQFFGEDLIDELILGIAPTVLGEGPSLAEGSFQLRTFELRDVETSGSGVVLRYERERGA